MSIIKFSISKTPIRGNQH